MTTSELELILRGGRVIDPAQGIDGVMDVGILGGRVAAVAPALAPAPRTKMINVHGKLVLPGLIDTHAHIYERSEEHTSELQSRSDLVCRLLLEKKKQKNNQ